MPRLYRILLFLAALSTSQLAADTIDYGRDIRPIFAANCFACHGPDEQARAADLRLDQRESAIDQGAIVASNPADSELIQRIDSNDAELVMPPPDSHKKLTDQEKRLLREWIAQGAAYADHWAFVAPKRPTVPKVEGRGIVRNAIDAFVLQRLDAANLKQSVAADRYTLARRVYLDLIGLPPTLEQAEAFASDTNPDAYENLVDRLLASPRYGERWARPWLDLARYSDTNGYEKDRERSIWPYRDWVIKALNDDMPYDQFSIEQLAGDMLPNPTESQLVATGFHRNTMLNEEGGIDPLEYRFYAVVDRVATTGTVWLGLTTGCAQCHTHKYDPITHTDYYRLFALLNNADEPDLFLKPPSVLKRRLQIERRIKSLTADLANRFPPGDGDGTEAQRREEHLEQKFAAWLAQQRTSVRDWRTIRPTSMKSNLPKLTLEPDGAVFSSGDVTKRDVYQLEFDLSSSDLEFPLTALRLEALPDDRLPARGPGRAYYEGRKGDFFLSELTGEFEGVPVSFIAPSRSYGMIAVGSGDGVAKNVLDNKGSTGWSTAQREGEPHQLVLNLAHPIEKPGRLKIEMLFERLPA